MSNRKILRAVCWIGDRQRKLAYGILDSLFVRMVTFVFVLTGCKPPLAREGLPPPPVTVQQPIQRSLTRYLYFTGRIEAPERVEIRARVKGFLKSIAFNEGAEVKKGELLYEIDPREFEAALAQANANEQQQQALLRRAREEEQRGEALMSSRAISPEEYRQRATALEAARAAVEQAKAGVEAAKLPLGFTTIRAPIDGRVGRTLVTEGNLVGFNEPTLLTTIVSLDPMYVYFEVPERDFLEYQTMIREQAAPTAEAAKVPVSVGLATEEGFPHEGIIEFRNNEVQRGTGTMQLRGRLPNPDRVLTPGLFARVRVPVGAAKMHLLVPEHALSSDQRGDLVLVVKEDDTVETRLVKTGATTEDGLIVLTEGVRADDWIVVNGMQSARPGAKVQPKRQ